MAALLGNVNKNKVKRKINWNEHSKRIKDKIGTTKQRRTDSPKQGILCVRNSSLELYLFYVSLYMDSITSTDDLSCYVDLKHSQENILLDIIRELCAEDRLKAKLKGKVNRIISDCDLTHHTSFHKWNSADATTSSLLGFMHKTASELTFDEQAELNQSIIIKIQTKIPSLNNELENVKQLSNAKQSNTDKISELQTSIDDKLNTIEEQENEKVELMMQWLTHRVTDVDGFTSNSSELLSLKTRILDLKSKILYLHILQNIFTETNQSIRAYSEIHKDLKDSIKETEQRIKNFKDIIDSDLN